jgi:predicted neutral ceramidase superfamily lipid hydrolase
MICVQEIPVAQLLVVNTPMLTAMITTTVLKTLAILLVDVLTMTKTAMMIMLAPMMIATLLLDV